MLDGVSCISAVSCKAVGAVDYSRTLIESWDGTRWTIQKSGEAPWGGVLNGVS